MVAEWLRTGMFAGDSDADSKADSIVADLASHDLTKTHARHIPIDQIKKLGIKVVPLESDNALQDAVLSVHHACTNTMMQTNVVKIIENRFSAGIRGSGGLAGVPRCGSIWLNSWVANRQ